MKKNIFATRIIGTMMLTLVLAACAENDVQSPEPTTPKDGTTTLTVKLPEPGTRMSYEDNGISGVKTRWEAGDKLKVFPFDDRSAPAVGVFTIVEGSIVNEGKEATFTGPALQADVEYIAFGPEVDNIPDDDGREFLHSLLGQKQLSNNDMTHLGAYDLINARFQLGGTLGMQHLTSLFQFDLTDLPAHQYTKFSIKSSNPEGIVTAFKYSSKTSYAGEFPLLLNNILLGNNETLTLWVMMSGNKAFNAGNLTLEITNTLGEVYVNTTAIPEMTAQKGSQYWAGSRYYFATAMQAAPSNAKQDFLTWYNGPMTTDFTLTDDIDLTGEILTPKDLSVGLTFDGGGHTISGLSMENVDGYCGLFAINWGTIKNVIMKSALMEGKSAGAIAGFNNGGTICGCQSIDCTIGNNETLSAGGIVAAVSNSAKIVACYEKGNIVLAQNYAGGIAATCNTNSAITACYAEPASVTASDAGGILGWLVNGTVAACYWQHDTLIKGISWDNGSDTTQKSTYANCWSPMNAALTGTPAEGVVAWGATGLVYP